MWLVATRRSNYLKTILRVSLYKTWDFGISNFYFITTGCLRIFSYGVRCNKSVNVVSFNKIITDRYTKKQTCACNSCNIVDDRFFSLFCQVIYSRRFNITYYQGQHRIYTSFHLKVKYLKRYLYERKTCIKMYTVL